MNDAQRRIRSNIKAGVFPPPGERLKPFAPDPHRTVRCLDGLTRRQSQCRLTPEGWVYDEGASS